MARSRVRITVLKRVDPSYIFDGDIPVNPGSGQPYKICTEFEEGQEYVIETDNERPEGFCPQAWHDIFRKLGTLHWGGSYHTGEIIACCTDGTRPVSFRLERLDE
ncbi:MAG: TIGR04076 family protein [Candidatus Bathyarchaeia archaeon]